MDIEPYTRSFSVEWVGGRYRAVRGEPCVVVMENGDRQRVDGSEVTDDELAALNAAWDRTTRKG